MATFTGWRQAQRRAVNAAALIGIAILTLAGGCSQMTKPKAPTGLLGLQWGDDAAEGARKLGLVLDHWYPWSDPAFESSLDADHPRAVLGVEGLVLLVRAGKALEGVQVIYRGCAKNDEQRKQLREGLRRELHLSTADADVPYEIWEDKSLVHFDTDRRDGTCTLTVAGPRFGKVFAEQLLRGGLGNLGNAVKTH